MIFLKEKAGCSKNIYKEAKHGFCTLSLGRRQFIEKKHSDSGKETFMDATFI